jgi:Fe-S cluster biogenesis protein NfuA
MIVVDDSSLSHSNFCISCSEIAHDYNRLERGLKERIPEIQEVIQSLPEGPPLVQEQIEIVLDGVRPFLQIVGGSIVLDRIEGLDSIQPSIILQMSGSSASLNSVKLEIAQRLQRHFMMSGLQIHWNEE